MRHPSLQIGAIVWWNGGAEIGRITDVCDVDFESHGVTEPGIFLCRLLDGDCAPIFYGDQFLEDDGIGILNDVESQRLHEILADVNQRSGGIFPKTVSMVIRENKACGWIILTYSEDLKPVDSFEYDYGI